LATRCWALGDKKVPTFRWEGAWPAASARAVAACVLKQFPNARFHFNSGRQAQQGTFKGVWLNKEHTEWALEKEQR
jgi:hypothetical protein